MVKISLVIPTYNCGRYLYDAIDSVIKQEYKDFEVIIVDDGSTDSTKDLVAEWQKKYPRLVRYFYQNNLGPGMARNKGIKEAKGEYIAFLDADDTLEEKSLGKRLEVFNRCEDIGLVFSDYYLIDSPNNQSKPRLKEKMFLDKFSESIASKDDGLILFNSRFFQLSVILNQHIHTGTVMVRKEILDALGGFENNLRAGEDQLMWYKISQKYKVAFVNLPLSYYNRYRGFLTKNDYILYNDSISFLKKLLSFVNFDNSLINITKERISYFSHLLGYYFILKGERQRAISCYKQGIAYNIKGSSNWKGLIKACFIPIKLRNSLRNLKYHEKN